MRRVKRICPAGEVFHVLNRSVARMTLFEKSEDYADFIKVVDQTWELVPLPIYAMVVMPNHWHFVVRPTHDDQVRAGASITVGSVSTVVPLFRRCTRRLNSAYCRVRCALLND